MKRRLSALLLALLPLFLSACAYAPGAATPASVPDGELAVHFIDVGQADSALLLCGGQAMLIDGGNAQDSSRVVSYLEDQGVDTLDYVVCTHAHEDHVGGLSGPLNTCAAAQVFSPVREYDSKAFRDFVRYTEAQGLTPTRPFPWAALW
jgi:competence protein ComEC